MCLHGRTGLLLLAVLPLLSCRSAPRVTVVAPTSPLSQLDLKVTQEGMGELSAELSGQLHSATAARVQGATWELLLDGKVLKKDNPLLSLQVPAGGDVPFQLPGAVKPLGSPQELAAWSARGATLPLTMKGVLLLASGSGGPREVPFSVTRALRPPRMPTVKLSEVNGSRYSTGEVGVTFFLGVMNPNPFPLRLQKIGYQVELGGRAFAEGEVGQGERVEPSSMAVFEIQVNLEEQAGPEAAAVARLNPLPYRIKGAARGELFEQPFDLSGALRLKPSSKQEP